MSEEQVVQQSQSEETAEVEYEGKSGMDLLSDEALDQLTKTPDKEAPDTITQKDEKQQQEETEDKEALNKTPFNSKEKLVGALYNMWKWKSPNIPIPPNLEQARTKDLVDYYKNLQRVEVDRPAPKETQKAPDKKEGFDFKNPLSNKEIRKAYENLVDKYITKEKMSYREAKTKADGIVNGWIKETENEDFRNNFQKTQKEQAVRETAISAAFNISKLKDDADFKKYHLSHEDIIKELDAIADAKGITKEDVIKLATKQDAIGNYSYLKNWYQEGINSLLVKKFPSLIEKVKEKSEIEGAEKVAGGTGKISSAENLGEKILKDKNEEEKDKDLANLYHSVQRGRF